VRGPSTKPIAPGGDFSQKHSYPVFRRSLALRHVDTGSCQAVESELGLLASPTYDLSRFGFSFTPSPRHADVLLVTGVGTDAMLPVLKATYEAMPGPKAVVLVGDCARHGCGLARCDAPRQRIASVVPVDLEVPGCPPTPEAILQGLLALTGRGRRP
jgi:Ni,Fe-hydrogenase III small subunit